jgi:NAD(P)-dependent dehydrogenase (short-subunit alcohol dehydrogenase family)
MANTYDLARKLAIITGGAKGIGRAITDRFLASGAEVWVWDTSPVRIPGVKSPDEVAHLVTWLCSEASRFNTGAAFDMSGGRARY